MKYLGYIFLLAGRFVLFPVYWLVGLMPRRPDLWVFGSWGGYRFADNSAAFFIHCNDAIDEQVTLVWISRRPDIVQHLRNQGYTAYWIWSPGGIWNAMRAGLHIFDCFPKDANFWLSRGAKKINLWSGVPLKVFERDIDNPGNRYYKLFHGNVLERGLLGLMMPWHLVKPDLMIATSDETARITSRAFAVFDSQVCVTGFPRNDALIDPSMLTVRDPQKVPEVFRNAALSDKTVLLYLPTFRDTGGAFINFDWNVLDEQLGRNNAVLFFKTHPVDTSVYKTDYENIFLLPQAVEVYSLLPGTDALISDYSSVIFDYMLLDRPIIYYTPDLVDFESGCRSFNFRPAEVAVGPLCISFEEFTRAIDQVCDNAANVVYARRDEIMKRLHKFKDARSNERVLRAINDRCFGGKLVLNGEPVGESKTHSNQTAVLRLSD